MSIQMEEVRRARCVGRGVEPPSFSGHQHRHVFTILKALLTPYVRDFYGGFIT